MKQWAHCAAPISVSSAWIAVLLGNLIVYIYRAEVRYHTRLPVFLVTLKRSRLTDGHRLIPFFKAKDGGKMAFMLFA